MNYSVWTADGSLMASSTDHARRMALSELPFGWAQGVRLMVVGEKRRLWVPEPLGYAPGSGRPTGALTIDVELLRIHHKAVRPKVPEDVAAVPADALKTPSGLAYRVLQKGKGAAHPGPGDTVQLEYSAWTSRGVMFRSTYKRGPERLRIDGLIAGWAEALQLMVVGDRFRVWIPETLAYQGQEGQPEGVLLFDLYLIDIRNKK